MLILLWGIVADEVNGVVPCVSPHGHLRARVHGAAHSVGGGPDQLERGMQKKATDCRVDSERFFLGCDEVKIIPTVQWKKEQNMVRIKHVGGQKAAVGALQFNDVPCPWKESRSFLIRMPTLPSQEPSYFPLLLRGQWKWRVSK